MQNRYYQNRSLLERGQALVEYGLMLVYISIALIVVIGAVTVVISNQLGDVTECLDSNGSRALTSSTCDAAESSADNDPPIAYFSESCSGLTCNFDASSSSDPDGTIVSYAWTFATSGTGTGSTASHTFGTTGSYTITLTVTDDGGLTDQYSKNVNVSATSSSNQAPIANYTHNCTSLSCQLISTSTDSDGTIVTYAWTANGVSIGNQASFTHNFTASGTYNVKLVVTDNNGAQAQRTYSVTATSGVSNASPTANFTFLCNLLACDFTNSSGDSDGTIASYAWDFDNNGTIDNTTASPSHSFPSSGTYTVSLTVTDNGGATSNVTKSVAVSNTPNTAPVADFLSNCTGFTCTFNDASTDDLGVVSYAWDFTNNGSTDATTANPSNTYAGAGTYTVKLTVTDAGGLSDTITKSVVVTTPNVNPTANFTVNCSGLTCNFTNTSSDTDGSVVSYAWDFTNDGTTDNSSQNPSHTYPSSGPYSARLTVTDNNGGTGTVTKSVTFSVANVNPTANFNASCANKVCTFTDVSIDTDGTIVSWAWAFGDGDTSTQQNPSHTYSSGSAKTVTLTVTDNSGGTHTTSKSVSMNATNLAPTADFNFTCTGLTCNFTSTSSDSDGSISSYAWDFENNGSTDASGATSSKTYSSAGSYTARLTVTDNSSATGTTTKIVTVSVPNVNPTASFTVTCNLLACDFVSTSTDSDGSITGYAWDFTNDGTTDNTTASPSHSFASANTYTVKLTVTDNGGASVSTTQSLTVSATNIPPVANFTPNCTGLTCTFTNSSTDNDGTIASYAWDFDNNGTTDSTTASPSHSYPSAGSYTAKLTVTDNAGATNTLTKNINVTAANVAPTADFTFTCTGLSCSFTNTSSDSDGIVSSAQWDFNNDNTNDSSLLNPSHTFSFGNYSVKLTVFDDDGASASITKTVTFYRISDVDEVTSGNGSNKKLTHVRLYVTNGSGAAVSGVTITLSNGVDCTSTVAGLCELDVADPAYHNTTINFTISTVTGGTGTYSAASNTNNDGDNETITSTTITLTS